MRMRVSFCVSSRGLCNAIYWSSAPAHYLCKECGTGTVSGYLLSGDLERDPNWPGHFMYVCQVHYVNFTGYWAASQFRLACITHRLTALPSVWIKLWSPWSGSLCMSLYNRGTRLRQLAPNYSRQGQGPFMVTRCVGKVDNEVVCSDRGGATQIYHLTPRTAWGVAELVWRWGL